MNAQKFVVVKEIDIKNMDQDTKKSCLREAKIMEKLSHPNIIKSYEVYKTRTEKLCIVMEYADGGDLEKLKLDKKKSGSKFTEEEILNIFCQIVMGLKVIHRYKIIHRDLKMRNIFINKNGLVKIGDFGISKVLDSDEAKARTLVGTPFYFSPEMCQFQEYDQSIDIWALGVVLYELCFLDYPFKGTTLNQIMSKIVKNSPEVEIRALDISESLK